MRIAALGFPSELNRASAQLVMRLAQDTRRSIEIGDSGYRVWRQFNGAELYFHYCRETALDTRSPARALRSVESIEELSGLTPFHAVRGELTLRVAAAHSFDTANPLQGCYIASLPGPRHAGRLPALVIEKVPFALHPNRLGGGTHALRVACFAEQILAFDTMRAYLDETPISRRQSLGSISAVNPSDVPELELEYKTSVISLGMATGHVVSSVRMINAITERPYIWLVMKTKAGLLDVFADPARISGDISTGHIVQVCGSLVGKASNLEMLTPARAPELHGSGDVVVPFPRARQVVKA